MYDTGAILIRIFLDITSHQRQPYRRSLETETEPSIKQIVSNNHSENREIIFQQHWAPLHFCSMAWQFLDVNFPGWWISRRGNTEWPLRSTDLTPEQMNRIPSTWVKVVLIGQLVSTSVIICFFLMKSRHYQNY